MLFKDTSKMTDKNGQRYILSKLKKHDNNPPVFHELLDEVCGLGINCCDDCKFEDFGICNIRFYEDDKIYPHCIRNSIVVLECLISKRAN